MEKQANKRDLIKEQATRLFADRGVAAVSVRDIAEVCEMKASNLYAHFSSKEHLVAELFHEGYAEYGKAVGECLQSKGNFSQKLEKMIVEICKLHDNDNARFRFLLITQHHHLQEVERDGPSNPISVICGAISAAMNAGLIAKNDPEFMAAALVGLIVQTATFRLYGRIKKNLLPMADEIHKAAVRLLEIKS